MKILSREIDRVNEVDTEYFYFMYNNQSQPLTQIQIRNIPIKRIVLSLRCTMEKNFLFCFFPKTQLR